MLIPPAKQTHTPPHHPTQVHKRGALATLRYLRHAPHVTGVLFLMPCHSTPLHAYQHTPLPLLMIPCEPPLPLPHGRGRAVDQTARLYSDPERFIASFMGARMGNKTLTGILPPGVAGWPVAEGLDPAAGRGERTPWPSHVVVYQGLAPLLDRLVEDSDYRVVSGGGEGACVLLSPSAVPRDAHPAHGIPGTSRDSARASSTPTFTMMTGNAGTCSCTATPRPTLWREHEPLPRPLRGITHCVGRA
jgi:hypothetical protein